MSSQNRHALAWSDIPDAAGLVNWSCSAHVAAELELSAGDLSWMALKDVDGLSWFRVPNLYGGSCTMAVPSKDPVKILSPSALKLRDTIYPSCPLRVECSLPVSRSQSLAVWSIEPVAHRLLWGSKATATTSFWWPAKVYSNLPVSVSHSLAVVSKLPVTILSLGRSGVTRRARWKREHRRHSYALPIYVKDFQSPCPRSGRFYRSCP